MLPLTPRQSVSAIRGRGGNPDSRVTAGKRLEKRTLATGKAQLRNTRFICPELLLVTQLLRPGMKAEIAATELALARRAAGDFDLAYVERWAAQVGCTEALWRTFARADELDRHG